MNNFNVKRMVSLVTFLLLVLTTMFVYNEWFFSSGILTEGDWYTLEKDLMKEMFQLPYMWSSAVNIGSSVLVPSFYPVTLFIGFIGELGFGFAAAERFVFMWPLVFFSLFGMYVLIYDETKSIAASTVGTLAYFYNSYFILGRTGHLTLMTAYAFLPLVFYTYHKMFKKKSIWLLLLTGILFSIISFYEIRVFYITSLLLLLYVAFMVPKRFSMTREGILDIMYLFSPFIIAGILNAYWIFALIQRTSGESSEFFKRILFGNDFMSLERSITLFHPFWTGGKTATFIVQEIPIYFWIIPLVAFWGLYVGRKSRRVLYFGLIALIGIILSKQVDIPFPKLYEWLFDHFPGFIAFREASKFYGLIAFSYSVLIGVAVKWLWSTYNRFISITVSLLIAALFMYNAAPLLNGDIYELLTIRNRPHDYEILNQYLSDDHTFSRTLWVPMWSRWSYYTEIHPRVNIESMISDQWGFMWNNLGEKEDMNYRSILTAQISDNLLDLTSIRYVVVPSEKERDVFDNFYDKRETYIELLRSIPYLNEIDLGTRELVIFENMHARPHIYASIESDTLLQKASIRKVSYSQINPTRYMIELKNINSPTHVYFTESYTEDWELYLGDVSWIDIVLGTGTKIPNSMHVKTDTHLQYFMLDPDYIRKNVDSHLYIENSDTSINIKGSIYYRPQAYVYFGLLLTVVGSILVIGVYAWLQRSL